MVTEEYKMAVSEVLDILEHTRQQDVEKISPQFMTYLKSKASSTYQPNLDHSLNISDMQLKPRTRAILAVIYRQFWCTEEQKIEFDSQMEEN